MAFLRGTLSKARTGLEPELALTLRDLDESLAGQPGLIMSIMVSEKNGRAGRLSLWQSRHDADANAERPRSKDIRSRLFMLSSHTEEVVLEVKSGLLPQGLASIFGSSKRLALSDPT